jgi:hypothetical protein
MITYYRLVYKDGSVGAWNKDKEWVEECAKFFRATIETKNFEI